LEIEALRSQCLTAASQVKIRLALSRFAEGVRRSSLPVAGLTLLTVLFLRLGREWRAGEWIVASGIVAAWLLVLALLSFTRLPGTPDLLRLLDQVGSWKDRFSSAWEFLQSPLLNEAKKLHLDRSQTLLPKALDEFAATYKIPRTRGVLIAIIAALAFAFSPWFRIPPDSRDLELTDGMKDAAALQAEALLREAARIETPDNLSEEEKAELEALRKQVQSVAEKLADADGLTAGEMLESLESQARAAEELSEKLGLFTDAWASEAMLSEMSQHPDTADLSLTIRDKAATEAAGEATALKELLTDEGITADAQDRMTRALEAIMQAAEDEDLVLPVGERFGNASRKMLESQPLQAARAFEELAKHFREIAGREASQEKLKELAESLREAGSEVSGSELEKMESLAQAAADGQKAPAGLQSLDSGAPRKMNEGGSNPAPAAGEQQGIPPSTAMKIPGAEQASSGEKAPQPGAAPGQGDSGTKDGKGEQSFSAPVPGEASPDGKSGSGLGMSDKAKDGAGEGGMLSAPIPGMEPGDASPGAGLSLGSGQSSQSGQGGDQAGTGTAELVDQESEGLKATGDSKVVTQAGKEGESTVRSIEGEAKQESATRSRQEVIADFIAVEEQALDDQSLPLSRRQHVLRYFSAIREQFERAEAAEKK
jgi:hypothetical protein